MKITLAKAVKNTPSCDLLVATTFRIMDDAKAELTIKIKGFDKDLMTKLNTTALAEGFIGKEEKAF